MMRYLQGTLGYWFMDLTILILLVFAILTSLETLRRGAQPLDSCSNCSGDLLSGARNCKKSLPSLLLKRNMSQWLRH